MKKLFALFAVFLCLSVQASGAEDSGDVFSEVSENASSGGESSEGVSEESNGASAEDISDVTADDSALYREAGSESGGEKRIARDSVTRDSLQDSEKSAEIRVVYDTLERTSEKGGGKDSAEKERPDIGSAEVKTQSDTSDDDYRDIMTERRKTRQQRRSRGVENNTSRVSNKSKTRKKLPVDTLASADTSEADTSALDTDTLAAASAEEGPVEKQESNLSRKGVVILTAGSIAVAGGVVAAILLLNSDEESQEEEGFEIPSPPSVPEASVPCLNTP